jgi:prolyl oligopeptidase
VTEDGRYLVINVSRGTAPENQIFIKDLQQHDQPVQELLAGFTAEFEYIGNDATRFYFLTDDRAPRRRVIAVDLTKPQRDAWQELIPESLDTLVSASLFGERLIANYLRDARSAVRLYRLDGSLAGELELPGLGTVSGFEGRRSAGETFFGFTNYVSPLAIYRYELNDGKTTLWRQPSVAMDATQFVTEQVFYPSRDGTKIPMILTYKRGLERNGSTPTLLYAYGGFNISLTPSFSPANAVWIDMGGIFAVPNLRGGGEYGREWHEAGMFERKQNVFDDFIAAAEYLTREGWTQPSKLAIRGGSNGGLLVGACMTQRPDLFGACLPAVGVMDMLRFHKFTIGWAWASEFGSSDDPDQFKFLLKYSPLHNIRAGTCYPATMVTTADRDDRVVPGHSFKFAAALQAAQSCDRPVLIRIETRAGHGAGTPVSKRIEEAADNWAFLVQNLGMVLAE